MGVLNRGANLDKDIQPFRRGKAILVAIVGDRDAPHEFHDEIRPAGMSSASVKYFYDEARKLWNSG